MIMEMAALMITIMKIYKHNDFTADDNNNSNRNNKNNNYDKDNNKGSLYHNLVQLMNIEVLV